MVSTAAATATAATAAAVTTTAMATMVMVAMAMATATAATAAAATTTATMTGDGHLFTAHKGDADDREKHRDAQNQSTVHPRILQQKKQVPWRNKHTTVPSDVCPRLGRPPSEEPKS
jgi:hypothetical protein